jgi:uncharacterized membrane protein YGL010W
MKKVDELLADYAAYHRTRGNVICHFIGIPLIMFGIFSMFQLIRFGSIADFTVTAAEVLILVVSVYYFTLDSKLAIGMLISTALIDFAAYAIGDWKIGLAAFVIGWIFQGIGHAVYEKRSPAFTKNLLHLLVGPIFLVNEAFHVRQVQGPQASSPA